jgi:hypothetical protein
VGVAVALVSLAAPGPSAFEDLYDDGPMVCIATMDMKHLVTFARVSKVALPCAALLACGGSAADGSKTDGGHDNSTIGGGGSTASDDSPGGRGDRTASYAGSDGKGGTTTTDESPGGRGDRTASDAGSAGKGGATTTDEIPGGRGDTTTSYAGSGGKGGTTTTDESPGGRGDTTTPDAGSGGEGGTATADAGAGGGAVVTQCVPPTGEWTSAGDMGTARVSPEAVLLKNGKVLMVGGRIDLSSNGWEIYTPSAELYDPDAGTWTPTGSLATARSAPALVLQSGRVLVVGGMGQGPAALASAEIYDPDTGSWSKAASMAWARIGHTATVLSNGRVLVAGGYVTCPDSVQPCDDASVGAEIYDPGAGTWTAAGTLNTMRRYHAATLLEDGRVLVAGGATSSCSPTTSQCLYSSVSNAEIYDPTTGSWTVTGNMGSARQSPQVLLADGRVLAAGGAKCAIMSNPGLPAITACSQLTSAEVYDPTTGTWSLTGSLNEYHGEPLTLLCDDNVLVAAGYNPAGVSTLSASAELYDPAAGVWSFTGSMTTGRDMTAVVRLADGRVLVAGGQSATGYQAGVEIYY